MNTPQRLITDREVRAWLAKGAVDRGVGEGLTFVASHTAAMAGRASWVLRYRLNGRAKEKVLGRYPDLPLKSIAASTLLWPSKVEKALLLEVPTSNGSARSGSPSTSHRTTSIQRSWRACCADTSTP